jgi:hypothetical protein
VRFVPATEPIYAEDASIRDGGAVIVLGPIVGEGSSVRVGISFTCGARCAEGQTLVIEQSGEDWAVTDATGPGWIS